MSDKLILVLEPKGTTRMALTPEVKESIRSLKHNPGFQYLLNKLSLQREFMRKTLEEEAHVDIRKVDRLQNGIYWSNWLERQVNEINATPVASIPARQLRKSEMDLLEEIRQNITLVGEGTDSATRP